jgi:hypothetical protein
MLSEGEARLAQEEQGKHACHGTPTSQVAYFRALLAK